LVGDELGLPTWNVSVNSDLPIDTVLDSIEVLHQLVARPRSWTSHNYGGCPGHPEHFNVGAGQLLFRYQVNTLLARSSLGVRLAESGPNQGLLVDVVPGSREVLVEPDRWIADVSKTSLEHAIGLFTRHGSSREDKKSAIVVLAGVLEERRKQVKTELASADESVLFEIANKFGLRHQNGSQQTGYRDEFLDWIFWWYLATIELLTRLSSGQAVRKAVNEI
jgi:hypothetical protein